MKYIDLRSDTVTQPTEEMRRAMLDCEVGDDVYCDDPTINKLEELAARISGKEAALFVPSGTMGNQIAIMTHTRRGDEIIVGANSHIFIHEVGAAGVLSGVSIRTIDCKNDIMAAEAVENAIRGEDIHLPTTGLICMENALANGRVLPIENMKEIYAVAKRHNIPVHTDGARLFNAAAALNIDVKEITQYTDSVMFCLSKGLCAPVGSILAGDAEFIKRSRKNRKLLGGGMRQAGFLAAAGIIALEKMAGRLAEDHDNAKYMAEKLSSIKGVSVLHENTQINMVFCTIDTKIPAGELVDYLYDNGIKTNSPEGGLWRFVTNNDVTKENIDAFISILSQKLRS